MYKMVDSKYIHHITSHTHIRRKIKSTTKKMQSASAHRWASTKIVTYLDGHKTNWIAGDFAQFALSLVVVVFVWLFSLRTLFYLNKTWNWKPLALQSCQVTNPTKRSGKWACLTNWSDALLVVFICFDKIRSISTYCREW